MAGVPEVSQHVVTLRLSSHSGRHGAEKDDGWQLKVATLPARADYSSMAVSTLWWWLVVRSQLRHASCASVQR